MAANIPSRLNSAPATRLACELAASLAMADGAVLRMPGRGGANYLEVAVPFGDADALLGDLAKLPNLSDGVGAGVVRFGQFAPGWQACLAEAGFGESLLLNFGENTGGLLLLRQGQASMLDEKVLRNLGKCAIVLATLVGQAGNTAMATADLAFWASLPDGLTLTLDRLAEEIAVAAGGSGLGLAANLAEKARVQYRAIRAQAGFVADRRLPLGQTLARMAAKLGSENGIHIRVALPQAGLPTMAPEMENQLLAILGEGLENLCRHSHASQAELAAEYLGERLQFVLFDDGEGFDPKLQGSRGLRDMAERALAVGAELGIFSRPGFGTNVVLTLPMPEPSQAGSAVGDGSLAQQRILLADPSQLFVDSLRNLLRVRGLNVVGIAQTAADLPSLLERLSPTLLLADFGLVAGSAGFTMAQTTRLVVLTADESDETMRAAFVLGASGFLGKNLNAEELLHSLERICRGEIQVSQSVASRNMAAALAGMGKAHLNFSPLQQKLLELLVTDLTYLEIAERLHVSEPTIKYNSKRILEKLHHNNRSALRKAATKST